MERQDTKQQQESPPSPDSVSSPHHSKNNSEGPISLSPPPGSPENSAADSYSSPLHSKHGSGEHISLSPPLGSPGSSPVNHIHGSSPENERPPPPPPAVVRKDVFKEPTESRVVFEEQPMAMVSRAVMEEPKPAAPKVDPRGAPAEGGGASGRRRVRPSLSISSRAKRDKMVKKAALGFRIFGFLFSLISFSVLAADRNQGWALDSFDRYKEFRYCMSVNVIGSAYSGAQAFDLSYNLATGKYMMHHQQQLRHYFDFALDQIIAYLLISASSSASIRVEDWESNFGSDKFPNLATASISMSFLAFAALACSSLISGYALCTSKNI